MPATNTPSRSNQLSPIFLQSPNAESSCCCLFIIKKTITKSYENELYCAASGQHFEHFFCVFSILTFFFHFVFCCFFLCCLCCICVHRFFFAFAVRFFEGACSPPPASVLHFGRSRNCADRPGLTCMAVDCQSGPLLPSSGDRTQCATPSLVWLYGLGGALVGVFLLVGLCAGLQDQSLPPRQKNNQTFFFLGEMTR